VPNGSSAAIAQDGLWGEDRPVSGREAKEDALLFGRPLGLKYRGRAVDERVAVEACQLVQLYASRTGQTVQRFKRNGSATEELTRVIGALATFDDVPLAKWIATLETVLLNPWWDGPPSIGVIFGPKIVQRNLDDPAHGAKRLTAGQRSEQDKMERTQRRLAVARGMA
jgi:hypothetical protein